MTQEQLSTGHCKELVYNTLLSSPLVQAHESIDFFINSASPRQQEPLREDPNSAMGEEFYICFLVGRRELSQRDRAMVESSRSADSGPVTEVPMCQALRGMAPWSCKARTACPSERHPPP